MSTASETLSERDEIEMLLPWYVTGKLASADMVRVQSYLAQHPEMIRHLDLIRAEQGQSTAVNEAIRLPASLSVHTVATRIGREDAARPDVKMSRFIDGIRSFFTMPATGGMRWAAAACAAIIVLQAVALGVMVANRGDTPTYQPASGAGPSATGSTVIVRFTGTASSGAIADALSALAMTIVDGPKPGGLFVVRIGSASQTVAERDQRITALRARSDVIDLVLSK